METTKTTVSKSKTASTLNLSEDIRGLDRSQKDELLSQIGELLVEQILSSVADSKSPVNGNSFAPLSKDYATIKKAETGSSKPNLDLTGSMLQSLDFNVSGNNIEIGVFGEDAGKADGHNNFSGSSKLPTRQFLPDTGEEFDKSIMSLISDTVDQYKADNLQLDPKELETIESKAELYNYLSDVLGDLTMSELKDLVLSSEMAVTLEEFNLLDLL